ALGRARLFARHAHREVTLATVAIDRHLALYQTLQPGSRGSEDFGEFGNDVGQLPSERLRFRTPDQSLGGPAQDADTALRVQADDPRARSGQHGFGETAAAVDQVARAHDVVALRAQLLSHFVEGLSKLRKIAFGTPGRHLNVKIARGYDLSGPDQASNRRHQIVGEIQSDPDC